MFDNFNFEVAKIFKSAEAQMQELNHPYVGSEHLVLALLKNNDSLTTVLNKAGLTYKRFRQELIDIVGIGSKNSDIFLYTPLLKRVVDNALNDAKEDNKGIVTTTHLFLGLLEEAEGIAIRIMVGLGIDLDNLYKELKTKNKKNNKLLIMEIGNLLNDSVDLNEKVVGRDKELNILIETLLRKNKNNPLLVGKAGVGKTAIVEELTRRIVTNNIVKELQNKKIIMLEMSSLVAGTKYRGEFEERLNKIIDEVIEQKDIILFIDEIHTLINAGGAEGAIDASNILKPYLARGKIKCIGATTTEEYNKYIAKDKALDRRFQKINIFEPNNKETLNILMTIKKEYENHHKIRITNQNIRDIVELTNKYIQNKSNPDKCLDVLDSVCARVKLKANLNNEYNSLLEREAIIRDKKEKCVIAQDYKNALKYRLEEQDIVNRLNSQKNNKVIKMSKRDILEVLETKTNIPLLMNKNQLISRLRKDLHSSIIAQDIAVDKILDNYKSYIYSNRLSPLSIVLCGPSGVGKTYTVKKIAESLNMNLIRLDMSEYNLETSVSKLIGTSAGYVGYDDNYIFKELLDKPYSIILLDEIEKANPKVLNLFLQILDEGYITSSCGEKINFQNTLIFMTSNIRISNSIGYTSKVADNEYLSKELISRMDAIIRYESINEDMAKKYISIKNKDINQEEILNISNYQKYGFRELDRCIKAISNI